ncbi:MAG TPA: hypothetical protein PK922_03305, partial [Syntrophorhabdus sp.]|nr:hypothetical protein [Syntrophorhabdus sp.]
PVSPDPTLFSFTSVSLPVIPHDCREKTRKINKIIRHDQYPDLPLKNIMTINISIFAVIQNWETLLTSVP